MGMSLSNLITIMLDPTAIGLLILFSAPIIYSIKKRVTQKVFYNQETPKIYHADSFYRDTKVVKKIEDRT